MRHAEFALFGAGKRAVPIEVRFVARQKRAGKKSFDLVFETNLFVRYGERVRGLQAEPERRGREAPRNRCVAIGEIGLITAENFVGSFAAQSDGDVLRRHSREKPYRDGAGV